MFPDTWQWCGIRTSVSINEVVWAQSHAHQFCIACGCFHTVTAELCCADIRDKAETLQGPLLKKFTDLASEVKEKDREEVLSVPLELVIYSQGFPVP